jgi:hypothetical protein
LIPLIRQFDYTIPRQPDDIRHQSARQDTRQASSKTSQ